MKSTDKPAFAQLLTDALAFYRQDVSTFALGVWWQACQPFSIEQVSRALTAHAMDAERGVFPPKPADVVRQLHGTHTDRSLVAWGKVLDAIHRVGGYESVAFDDAAIHAAITDMGGWPTICRSEVDELPFLQKRFCDLHRVFAQRGGGDYPPWLVGDFEAANRSNGLPTRKPLLVGDAAVAQRVMEGGSDTGRVPIARASDALLIEAPIPVTAEAIESRNERARARPPQTASAGAE